MIAKQPIQEFNPVLKLQHVFAAKDARQYTIGLSCHHDEKLRQTDLSTAGKPMYIMSTNARSFSLKQVIVLLQNHIPGCKASAARDCQALSILVLTCGLCTEVLERILPHLQQQYKLSRLIVNKHSLETSQVH